jgi:CBS domain-containing protein
MEDLVQKVEEEMKLHHASSVPVVDEKGVIFGIISSPDIVHFHEAHKNPRAVRAWEMCTYKPIEVHPDATAEEVARLMVKNGIHHVVVTENGSLVGIVSSLDFVQDYLKHIH